MRVPNSKLAEIRDRGFTIVENFIDPETLRAAQEALWTIYPKPDEYFSDPTKFPAYARSQFAGIRLFPFDAWAINKLAVYPDLIDAAERFLGTRTSSSTRASCGPNTPARLTTTSRITATTATIPSSYRARTESARR